MHYSIYLSSTCIYSQVLCLVLALDIEESNGTFAGQKEGGFRGTNTFLVAALRFSFRLCLAL